VVQGTCSNLQKKWLHLFKYLFYLWRLPGR